MPEKATYAAFCIKGIAYWQKLYIYALIYIENVKKYTYDNPYIN